MTDTCEHNVIPAALTYDDVSSAPEHYTKGRTQCVVGTACC